MLALKPPPCNRFFKNKPVADRRAIFIKPCAQQRGGGPIQRQIFNARPLMSRYVTQKIPTARISLWSMSIWANSQTGRKEAIPRHNEIKKYLARSICRNLSVPVPPGD
jgi:hypothetical protein